MRNTDPPLESAPPAPGRSTPRGVLHEQRAHARAAAVVALIGNPNTGKTSLFNALTGYRRHVANYPGVTVEVARGPARGVQRPIELLDLPGTYSLAAVSPDEMLVCNAACGRVAGHPRPDAVLAIVDAANLSRNLYLVSQALELGLPVVVAVNMIDLAARRGISVDCEALARRLGVPVVPVVATQSRTVPPLAAALERAVEAEPPSRLVELPAALLSEVEALSNGCRGGLQRAEALRILLDREGFAEQEHLRHGGAAPPLAAARQRLAAAGIEGPTLEVRARYDWVNRNLAGVIARTAAPQRTWSDAIDRVLTDRIAGVAVLVAVLATVFQAMFLWARPLMDAIGWLFDSLSAAVGAHMSEGIARSLVQDGLIAGVGGVVVFLPQILLLFAFVAILEDCGYLARAAYMMDRLMRSVGLSGRAFIPLLSSFACAVPAIMGTRTIADRRERFVTILLAPFMSCSARLPVYVLMIGAFVPAQLIGGWLSLQGLVMLAMYLVGVAVAVPLAWLLRRTALRGQSVGFIMELPTYKWPRWRAIWQRMYFAGRGFLVRAGTVILLVNLIVWALAYFPHRDSVRAEVEAQAAAAGWDESRVDAELAGAYLRDSFLGRMGHAIEPVIRPIGWDWRIGVAVLASFPAREVVVATLGTIYNLGGATDEEDDGGLSAALQAARWPGTDRPVFTLPVALSIMVFFALCAQCASTLVIMGRETGSLLWPVFSFTFMTATAYFAAWGTFAAASALGF